MLTTIEAEIDVTGNVTLLEQIVITKKSRAILTLLDSENVQRTTNGESRQVAEERFAKHFGAIKSGDSNSADNDKIDADLLRILNEQTND